MDHLYHGYVRHNQRLSTQKFLMVSSMFIRPFVSTHHLAMASVPSGAASVHFVHDFVKLIIGQ